MKKVLTFCSKYFNLPKETFADHNRAGDMRFIRHLVFWLIRTQTTLSYNAMARDLKRDHTTIVHSVQVVNTNVFYVPYVHDLMEAWTLYCNTNEIVSPYLNHVDLEKSYFADIIADYKQRWGAKNKI